MPWCTRIGGERRALAIALALVRGVRRRRGARRTRRRLAGAPRRRGAHALRRARARAGPLRRLARAAAGDPGAELRLAPRRGARRARERARARRCSAAGSSGRRSGGSPIRPASIGGWVLAAGVAGPRRQPRGGARPARRRLGPERPRGDAARARRPRLVGRRRRRRARRDHDRLGLRRPDRGPRDRRPRHRRARSASCARRSACCSRARRRGWTRARSAPRSPRRPGVVGVHDLHLWTITSGFPALSAHVLVAAGADCHAIRREVDELLRERFELTHTTLQVEHAPGLIKLARGEARGQDGDRHRRVERDRRRDRAGRCGREGARVAGGARRVDRVDTDVALELDVTDAASCERFVAAAVEQLGGRRRPRQQRRASRSAATRSTTRPRPTRQVVLETNVARPDPDDAPRACRTSATAATSSTWARSRAGRRTRTARSTSPRSSPSTASRTRCARICSAGRSGSRTSTPGLVETDFSMVRFRGDEAKASAVYADVALGGPVRPEDVAECVALRADAAAERERRRDRRHGARAVERRPHPPRGVTPAWG